MADFKFVKKGAKSQNELSSNSRDLECYFKNRMFLERSSPLNKWKEGKDPGAGGITSHQGLHTHNVENKNY